MNKEDLLLRYSELKAIYLSQDLSEQDSFRSMTIIGYAQDVLKQFDKLNSLESPEEFIKEFQQFFNENRRRVKASLCEYNSTAKQDITLFLFECVFYLVEVAKEHGIELYAVEILFPDLTSFEYIEDSDIKDLREFTIEELKDFIQKHLITDKGYFIPILRTAELYVNETDEEFVKGHRIKQNPFGQGDQENDYSDADIEKVMKHSELGRNLKNLKEARRRCIKKENTLLAALIDLHEIFGRFCVKNNPLYDDAPPAQATEGLSTFCNYWDSLSADVKKEVCQIKDFFNLTEEFYRVGINEGSKIIIINNRIMAEVRSDLTVHPRQGHSHIAEYTLNKEAKRGKFQLKGSSQEFMGEFQFQKTVLNGVEMLIVNLLTPATHVEKDLINVKENTEQYQCYIYNAGFVKCISGWRDKIHVLIEKYETVFSKVGLKDSINADNIQNYTRQIQDGLKALFDSFKNGTYVGDDVSITMVLLEALNLEFKPRTLSVFLRSLGGVSPEDLNNLYMKYEHLKNLVNDAEQLIYCSLDMPSEKFQVILKHLKKGFFTEGIVNMLFTGYNFSEEYKLLIIDEIYNEYVLFQSEKWNKFSEHLKLRHLLESLNKSVKFSEENIQQNLKTILIKSLKHKAFCQNVSDFKNTVITIQELKLSKEDSTQILFELSFAVLNDIDKIFCRNNEQFCVMINEINRALFNKDSDSSEQHRKDTQLQILQALYKVGNEHSFFCTSNNELTETIRMLENFSKEISIPLLHTIICNILPANYDVFVKTHDDLNHIFRYCSSLCLRYHHLENTNPYLKEINQGISKFFFENAEHLLGDNKRFCGNLNVFAQSFFPEILEVPDFLETLETLLKRLKWLKHPEDFCQILKRINFLNASEYPRLQTMLFDFMKKGLEDYKSTITEKRLNNILADLLESCLSKNALIELYVPLARSVFNDKPDGSPNIQEIVNFSQNIVMKRYPKKASEKAFSQELYNALFRLQKEFDKNVKSCRLENNSMTIQSEKQQSIDKRLIDDNSMKQSFSKLERFKHTNDASCLSIHTSISSQLNEGVLDSYKLEEDSNSLRFTSETTNKEYCKTLIDIAQSNDTSKEEKSLLLKLFLPALQEDKGFCTNIEEFYTTIKCLSTCQPYLTEKEQEGIAQHFFKENLMTSVGFCANREDVLETITLVGSSLIFSPSNENSDIVHHLFMDAQEIIELLTSFTITAANLYSTSHVLEDILTILDTLNDLPMSINGKMDVMKHYLSDALKRCKNLSRDDLLNELRTSDLDENFIPILSEIVSKEFEIKNLIKDSEKGEQSVSFLGVNSLFSSQHTTNKDNSGNIQNTTFSKNTI